MKKTVFMLLLILFVIQTSRAQTWQYVTPFPKTASIIDITIGQGGNVFVLTSDRQIYRSSDHGNTWIPFVKTPAFFNILQIKASKVSNRVFAKTNCCGVAYTDNFGANWFWDNLSTNPENGLGLAPLSIDVNQSKVAAIAERFVSNPPQFLMELYISNNNGTLSTWSVKYTFPQGDHSLKDVFLPGSNLVFVSFKLNPNAPSNTVSLRKSIDGGTTFSDVSFFNGKQPEDLLMTPSQEIYCIANNNGAGEIFKSTDTGNTWTNITGPSTNTKFYKLAYDFQNDFIFLLTEDGIYRMNSSGIWQNILTNNQLNIIAINNNQEILTGGLTITGILKSQTHPIQFNTVEIGSAYSPAWLVVSGNSIFIGNRNNPVISKMNLNNPVNWQHTTLINKTISQEQVEQGQTIGSYKGETKNDGNLIITGDNYLATLDSGLNTTVIADESSGAPLAPLTNPIFAPLGLKLGNNDEIMIKQTGANYIDMTTDGSTWSVLNPIVNQAMEIILDYAKGTNHYFILTRDFTQVFGYNLYKSTDGITWNRITLPPNSDCQRIYTDRLDQPYLLATNPLTLYRLDMINEQWIATNLSLDNDPNLYFELAFDQNNRMFALNFKTTNSPSNSQGIAYSDDQGNTWTYFAFPTENGNNVLVENMEFDNQGRLYVKTSNFNSTPITHGIYTYNIPMNVNKIPGISMSIYPNPFSGFIFVKIEENATYIIQDLSGRSIISGNLYEGENQISIPENTANGIYLFTVRKDNYSYTGKIILKR